jgi:hypothetical protein
LLTGLMEDIKIRIGRNQEYLSGNGWVGNHRNYGMLPKPSAVEYR